MSAFIIDCPSCSRKLRVPDDLLGKAVKCPTCESTFEAPAAQQLPAPPGMMPPTPGMASSPVVPSSHRNRAPLESEDRSRSCPRCGERNEHDAARCRFCGEEFDNAEEEDDRPWDEARNFPGRRDAEPHRGTLVLVLGIVSIVMVLVCGVVGLPLGIAAWVLGRRDLVKMRQHLMDREGEGLTQAGWICGIIGTILNSLWLLCMLVYVGFVFTMISTARRAPAPPMPAPAPPPARQPLGPPPGPPGNRATLDPVHSRWQDS